MAKKTVADLNFSGKCALMRADFNVPLDDAGHITDDRRIRAALPTIRKILDDGGRLILMSHLGRPEGAPDPKYSLAPVARRLGEILERKVPLAPDCVGPEVAAMAKGLQAGGCMVLENLRFHEAEVIKDKKAKDDAGLRAKKDGFAKALASLADVYVNDAFGTCHRDNASMLTVPQMMEGKPRVVGFLIKKELEFLGGALTSPKRPFVVILGGAKVSDKIGVIEHLTTRCDTILVGGAMAYTFMAADGLATGNSKVEKDFIEEAKRLKQHAGEKLKLPTDSVVAAKLEPGAATQVAGGAIPEGMMGLDIGPETVKTYEKIIAGAQTVVWNGPMGVFETPPFDRGTLAVAAALATATDKGAVTIIGGGDSAAAVEAADLADRMSHVSTGGGASLEFLEGKKFAPLEVLDEA
ncbi:MAG TPA: phosphoglycerate kinase [Phycisphaerae bacterium]|mgnify:CR=1 FL=1|nr:phosphoglycerate kinase [Phycisphaerales bacterium]HRX85551.1 phosphoglycerate kinase [Phycisphaerae bacterium]